MVQSRRRIYKWNFARQILWMVILGMLLRDPMDLGSRGSWILNLCFIVGSWRSCILIFFAFAVGSWRYWILNFCLVMRSWRSWILTK